MTRHVQPVNTQLVPLTSIRFFAALHILVFHIYEFHRTAASNPAGFRLPVFDHMPPWLLHLIQHGYCSTGLFFLLSGFILAYLYIDAARRMTTSAGSFLWARWSRIYPLHILVLLLLAPFVIGYSIQSGNVATAAISGMLNVLLIQAWFPPYALSWNFPTWALSAVVFFYLAFPLVVRILQPLRQTTLLFALVIGPLVSVTPTLIYLSWRPDEAPLSFWNEWIMRTPLLWLPHFVMGVLLARAFNITRYDDRWRRAWPAWRPSVGDAAAVLLLAIMVIEEPVHQLILRHGLLAPLFLVLMYDLAQNRGVLSSLLSSPLLRRLGDASFGIFILQLPMGMLAMMLGSVWPMNSALLLLFIIVATILVSIASTRFVEKPLAAALRRVGPKRAAVPSATEAIT